MKGIKMNNRFIILLIVVLFLFLFIITACSSSISTKIIGTWKMDSGDTDMNPITFFSDGTCQIDNETGNWSNKNGTFKISGPFGGMFWDHDNFVGTAEFKDGRLVLTGVFDGEKKLQPAVYSKEN